MAPGTPGSSRKVPPNSSTSHWLPGLRPPRPECPRRRQEPPMFANAFEVISYGSLAVTVLVILIFRYLWRRRKPLQEP
jgi:hypothetical protein